MTMISDWLRQLFCRHDWRHYANIYGDQINAWAGNRSAWKCSRCGKLQGRDQLGINAAEQHGVTGNHQDLRRRQMLCPKTGKGCCDDLCHGSGCLELDGYAMLAECDVCGGLVDGEIPECSTCTCGDEDDYYDWPEDDVTPDAERPSRSDS